MLDLVQHRRGQPGLLHEEPLGKHGVDLLGERLRDASGSPRSRGEAGPGCRGLLVVRRFGKPHADHLALASGFSRDGLDGCRGDPGKRREVGPLVSVRHELVVHEQRVALLARAVLEWESNEVPEAAPGHGVLAREEPIVRCHAELMSPGHRLRDQMAAHLPREDRWDGGREEEPHVSSLAGAGALDGPGQTSAAAGRDERRHVLHPRALVEVGRQEPAALVVEHGVGADDVAPVEMVEDNPGRRRG